MTPANAADLVDSANCRQALASLQSREAAVLAQPGASVPADALHQRAPDARLAAARRHAAQACLGGPADAAPPRAQFRPPVSVSPVAPMAHIAPATPITPVSPTTAARPAPLPGQPMAPAELLRKPTPPIAVISCDAAGCWANDGSRLERSGPYLLGPRGLCSLEGTLLRCP